MAMTQSRRDRKHDLGRTPRCAHRGVFTGTIWHFIGKDNRSTEVFNRGAAASGGGSAVSGGASKRPHQRCGPKILLRQAGVGFPRKPPQAFPECFVNRCVRNRTHGGMAGGVGDPASRPITKDVPSSVRRAGQAVQSRRSSAAAEPPDRYSRTRCRTRHKERSGYR